jgi:heptosyltransferase-3
MAAPLLWAPLLFLAMTDSSPIAIVRTDRLGDMVLTLPMAAALRQVCPGRRIVMAARRYVQPLLESVDVIDDVIYVDDHPNELRHGLRRLGVTTAFFPRARPNEAWQALRAGVRHRIGTAYRWYSPLLYTSHVRDHRKHGTHHEAEYNMRMVAHFMGVATPSVTLVRPRLAPPGVTLEPNTVILHPGSGGSTHTWPIERMADLARTLADSGLHVAITGTLAETHLADVVMGKCPAAQNLCGTLSMSQLMPVIAQARALVANGTGVLHLAASIGIPVVGIFPRDPALGAHRWGPYTKRGVVVEPPTGGGIHDITAHETFSAVQKALLS